MLDLLIRDGDVVDGTGRDRRRADVAIRGGRIVEIGTIHERAARTISAEGMVVAPGFVDVHTHYDVQAFWDPLLTPSSLHGVTTVLGGNCGFTVAPLDDSSADYLMRMLSRVEGMPLTSLQTGVPWNWRTTAEYLDRFEGRLAINAGFSVGHSALRRVVMGEAATERVCTEDEFAAMSGLLHDGLAAGGLGFSSSLGDAHSDGDGRPVPSRHADAHEIAGLAAICRDYPGTSLEFMPQISTSPFSPERVDLMTSMSRLAQRPLNWNLLSVRADNADEVQGRLAASDHARAHGARIVALMMPIRVPARFNFLSGFILDMIDGWSEAMALGEEAKLALLSDPGERARLGALAERSRASVSTNWGSYQIVETFIPQTARFAGRSVADIASELQTTAFDALLDIVVADRLRTTFGKSQPPDTTADWEARATLMRDDPRILVGASDAGAHLDMIGTFNYCTRLLAEGVRTHQALGLEEAVHHLTQAPAQFYGLRDRGVLTEGACADVVIFDESTIGSEELSTRADLPGGAARLFAGATGIAHVIVNGCPILDHGAPTGDLPGAVLRSGRNTVTPPMS